MLETTATTASASIADQCPHKNLSKHKSSPFRSRSYSLRAAILFLVTFICLLVLLQILARKQQPFSFSSSSSSWYILQHWNQFLTSGGTLAPLGGGDCAGKLGSATSRMREMVAFLPLKNASLADRPTEGTTWFMSSLEDVYDGEQSQYLHFPSAASKGRLLCLAGNDSRDGTRNSYALAWPDALPANAALLPGLTFVSDSFYGYKNIWHGLGAVVPFVGWHLSRGCARPARWVLYFQGGLRTEMAYWVRMLAEVTLGQKVRIEGGVGAEEGPSCFEEAVVFRHNEGAMPRRKRMEVYDTMRCKARAFCNVVVSEEDGSGANGTTDQHQQKVVVRMITIRMTLLLRTGKRSFKNDSAVIGAFSRACGAFPRCRLTVVWANQLRTFCDQVRALSATDVLVSTHGAQVTNMIFMNRNRSLMEMFPKGWLELAGPGQYVFHWLAGNAGMRHRGTWRDPHGVACPFPADDSRCFLDFYKDQQLGDDGARFADWTAQVLTQVKEEKLREAALQGREPNACPCVLGG